MHLRLPAGLLSFVLAVGVLVSTGLSMMILYLYYARQEALMLDERIRVERNLRLATDLALWEYAHFQYDQIYLLDLFGKQKDSITIQKMRWGLIDQFRVSAYGTHYRQEGLFWTGQVADEHGRSAIWLLDEDRPLSVVGHTRITGDSYLPVSGIGSAYINRSGYRNDSLLYGRTLQSEKEMPAIDLKSIFSTYLPELQEQAEAIYSMSDTIIRSFREAPAKVLSSQPAADRYQGQTLLYAQDELQLSRYQTTEDILAFAPIIILDSGFVGSGQFFATDSLVVGENVRLEYPSVVAIYNPDGQAHLHLDTGAQITGWVLLDGDENSFRDRLLVLGDSAIVHGMVYANGLMEVRGKVEGHITARRFLVNTYSGIYENYLMNATIDATVLDSAFLALPQWFYTQEAKLLKLLK